MRKIVAGLFVTLDGVTEAPEKWNLDYFSPEMGEVVQTQTARSDTMLLGRKTYQEFAAYFGSQGDENPMAAAMNNIPKLVVSTTLTAVDWQNSTLVTGDPAEALAAEKQKDGKDITVSGSVSLVRWLVEAGLLDELQLLVHPLVLGTGAKLFPEGSGRTALKLVDTKAFPTGVVFSTYTPAD